MEKFTEFFRAMAARVAQGLGLKPGEREQLRRWQAGFEQELRDQQDRWDSLKGEVRKLESRLLQKKAEYEAAHGLVKEMVGQEIEQLFGRMDRQSAQSKLVRRNLDALNTALDKIRELEEASAGGVKEEQLDELAVRLEDALAEVRQADAALDGLAKIEYTGRNREPVDLEERLAEYSDAKEPAVGLSANTLERLHQLEKETED